MAFDVDHFEIDRAEVPVPVTMARRVIELVRRHRRESFEAGFEQGREAGRMEAARNTLLLLDLARTELYRLHRPFQPLCRCSCGADIDGPFQAGFDAHVMTEVDRVLGPSDPDLAFRLMLKGENSGMEH